MRQLYSSGRVTKNALLFFVLFFAGAAFAQSGQPLDDNALNRLRDQNQKNGLPLFYKIYEQYNFTFDNAELAAKYSDQLLGSIRSMSGVINCSIDMASKTLHVQFPKDTEKEHGAEHIAAVKALMDQSHLRMTGLTQASYHM